MFDQELNPAASMTAVEIDVRCALEFARAAMKGVTSVSPAAKAVVLAALDDAAEALKMEGAIDGPAVAAVLAQARHELALN